MRWDLREGLGHRLRHVHSGSSTPYPKRVRSARDQIARSYSIRTDGTIVLPIGVNEPDLSIDELTRIARARAAALRPLQPTG